MKPRIITRINSPHGGDVLLYDPLTNFEIHGTTFNMAYDRLCNYRRSNGHPIGLDFPEQIEEQFCNRYPNECEVNRRTLGVPLAAPGLYDVARASAIMIKHKINDSELVSQDEANRRAQICRNCPLRAQMTLPCSRCFSALENVVGWITGARGTPYDEKMSACGVCSCYISASVWLPLSTQCLAISDDMKERFAFAKEMFGCWKECT
jgi:hypothetical protein